MSEKEKNIKALISFYRQRKILDGMSQEEATIIRHSALIELFKYIPYIPIGQSEGHIINDQKGRLRLFEERGKRCEICCSDLNDKPFELHHTNYYRAADPECQKILCLPCHKSIKYVHGLVKIFEDKIEDFPLPPTLFRLPSGKIVEKIEFVDEE